MPQARTAPEGDNSPGGGRGRGTPEPALAPPAIALPKGGGAIRGIGEKFAANPTTGSGSFSVPVPTSPGRSGFGPRLELSYDSSAGNGAFGFGWSLSLPAIARKTDKGLPRYLDAVDSDIFILSGAEDLVPVYREDADGIWTAGHPGYRRDPATFRVTDPDGRLVVHEDELEGYRVRRYRPRIEGPFARIERWSKIGFPGDVHWRSISGENVLTLYGFSADSRIADPHDANRIFTWLICETRDDRGNAVLYRYKAEDGEGVDVGKVHERNRGPEDDARRTANRYLKRIYYGNRDSLLVDGKRPTHLPQQVDPQWMFEVVFDYGEHDDQAPAPDDAGSWTYRPDPFSSYRSGFEVRTTRLCARILMFHHFPDEPAIRGDCLVRSLDLTYSDELDPADVRNPVYAFLKAVTETGYRRAGGAYDARSLPPVEFEYTEPVVHDELEEVDPETMENLPVGLDGSTYRWTDLHGEGIPGILTEQADGWFYKRNLSPLPVVVDGRERVRARFAALETVALKPNVSLSGTAELMDLAGDGQPDVVVMEGAIAGMFEHDEAEGWQPFRPFTSRLTRNLRDPNVRFVDLDGDGHADVLITEHEAFVWHPSLAETGFGPAQRVVHALDEEKGPRIVFGDSAQSIHLADLSGDGVTDIVRIRNGEVCYWPNLGYGRFGAKVTMDNAPWFDHPDQFDQRRIRLADVDGSGTTDILYLHRDGVRLYFNQSGNGWSRPQLLEAFPRIDDPASIVPTDLLGNGTACLVWSSSLPGDSRRPMRYVNLMGERKPHLLVRSINNLGAETRVVYAPSTKFYLQDKRVGRPWITRLPFPVHVVEQVETYDHVSRNRFVTRYAYHHGYFDGEEREFRGFSMVEEWDTEHLAALAAAGAMPRDENINASSHVAPVHIKSWFHTGAYVGQDHVTGPLGGSYQGEYFQAGDLLLPDTILPGGLTDEEEREACRALKGAMLRQEIYADDAGPGADPSQIERARTPFAVTEQNFSIRVLQPRGSNRHAAFFTHARETIKYHYERNPADPRIEHELTLEVDAYGNVLKRANVGYGRRATIRGIDAHGQVQQVPNPGLAALAAADQAKQTATLLTYTENRVTNAIESADAHRNPLPCETAIYELTGYTATGAAGRFQAGDLVEPDSGAAGRLRHRFTNEVPYEASPGGGRCRRRVEWLRTLYRRDDLAGLLPLGELHPLGLPGESYSLAFTPGLLTQVFRRPRAGQPAEALLPDPAAVLGGQAGDRGGYLPGQVLKADGRLPASDPDGHWWVPSGRSFFTTDPADSAVTELTRAREHFFLPLRYRDAFGHDTSVGFDPDDLLIVETRDALGNRITVDANDYRVLQPRLVSDPNRNRTEVAFDTLGMVVGSAVMGKPPPAPAEGDTLAGFLADLTQAQTDGFVDTPNPHLGAPALLQDATTRVVYDLDRFRRSQRANPDDPTRWQPVCAALLARDTHANAPLPPQGLRIQLTFAYSDGFGREIQKKTEAEPGPTVEGGPVVDPRWVGSRWTIFNNKGKPVRQYEPFFSATHHFEFGVQAGVSPVLFYDAVQRVIATLYPNHTYSKARFDPWQETAYDVNDTCAPRNAETGDPRTDPEIQGFVAGYFESLLAGPPTALAWQTWYAERIGGALGPHEQAAATRAAAHADTPTTAYSDALGRPFLTVARNRVVCAGHDLDGTEASSATRVELDIEGNERAVRDAVEQAGDPLGRIAMRYAYDMLGNRIHQLSMEAGGRWLLNDVSGKPIRAWDSRGHNTATAYDALRRPVEQTVRGTIAAGEAASDPRTLNSDVVTERIEYGEPAANASQAELDRAQRLNLRTQVFRHFDSAGVVTKARLDANGEPVEAYDFKGNLLCSTRRLVTDHTGAPDWGLNPQLDTERFEGTTRYDALNRPVQSIAPDSSSAQAGRSVIQAVYKEAGRLDRVDVWLQRAAEPAALIDPDAEAPSPVGISGIDYDAKGQRLQLDYKNGTRTSYEYDPLTFRLTHLVTRRDPAAFPGDDPDPRLAGWPGREVQSLHYTYDPAGNITNIQDDAQQTLFFRNQRVEPSNDYTYDALYRLIQATGREHLGQQAGGGRSPPTSPDAFNAFHTRLNHPGDGNAMGTYVERYVYDAAGNFVRMQHRGSDPSHAGWTRAYEHLEPSLIEDGSGAAPLKSSNRLSRSVLDPNSASPALVERYEHDAHGNMIRMPHLGGGAPGPNMHWDHNDRLCRADLGGGGKAYYLYDASGQRVRKVWEKAPGLLEERIYLGGFEIFRRHGGPIGATSATLQRETLHVMDDRQRIALVETRSLDTAGDDQAPARLIRYQLANHLGSASLELDDQARIIAYEEHAPYGGSTYQAVRSQTEVPKRYRYAGKERDEESGLYYYGARYYAAWIALWTTTDPIASTPSRSQFAAFANNPLRFTDPTGNQDDDIVSQPARIRKIQYFSPEEMQQRVEQYKDKEPPPKLAREKTQPVHNITEEHQLKVLSLINWAIASTAREDLAKNRVLTKDEETILSDALGKIIALRQSKIPDASDNLIYRDADHYLAARLQEWRTRAALELASRGLIDPGEARKLALSGRSRENNKLAAGPAGANQLYETRKLQEFKLQALSGQAPSSSVGTSDKAPSAAGATEWKLLGMIDYERYDAGNDSRQAVPHLVVDLPGTAESYASDPTVPEYLRDDARRISERMQKEARFTK
jgi:RHS repeat-associated protein